MSDYRVERKIVIQAAPDKVWAAVTDVGAWPAFKPFIKKVSVPAGGLAVGGRFTMRIKVKPSLPFFVPVPVRITGFEPLRHVAWTGGLPFLSTSTHGFILEPAGATVSLTSYEHFTGALVGLMLKFVTPADLNSLHDRWLEAIKRRVEPGSGG